MIIDGRAIAEAVYNDIRTRVRSFPRAPRCAILTCHPTFETQKYLSLKEKKAGEVGIEVRVVALPLESSTEDVCACIRSEANHADALIVQLPLPATIDTERVLQSIPLSHDADVLNPSNIEGVSPVVGAMREILSQQHVSLREKRVVVIGNGRLVGAPVARWCKDEGALVTTVTKDAQEGMITSTRNAEVIVCGAGVPGLLTADMISEGVIILDAGTSEASGVLRGDADPSCASKSSLFTPVPGGIGPLTIAILLRNVLDCATKQQSVV